MRIKKLQQRLAQVGEIRFGDSVPVPGKTYRRPVKLETFKLTTADRELADVLAELYGGKPEWWEPQNGGLPKWAVQTESKALPVVVPPPDMVEPSTSYEMWDRGQPKRRCDGEVETISGRACICGPEGRARGGDGNCKIKMRVTFMLADLVSAGTWLVASGGWYAATELPTVYDLLQAQGGYQRGRLLLQQRKAHKPGESKPRMWPVPVLDVPTATAATAAQLTGVAAELPAAPSAPALEPTPGPESTTGVVEATDVEATAVDDGPAPTDPLADVEAAADRVELYAVWARLKDAGQLTKEIADAIKARAAVLPPTAPAQEPVGAAAEPVAPSGQDEDAANVWMACVGLAGRLGMDTPALEADFADRMGKPASAASLQDLHDYHHHLKTRS